MVTVNVDTQDMLINGKVWEVLGNHLLLEIMNSIVEKVYIKFHDTLVGRNAMLSDHFDGQLVLHNCKNVMQIYHYVKVPSYLASNEPVFHLWCSGHLPNRKHKI